MAPRPLEFAAPTFPPREGWSPAPSEGVWEAARNFVSGDPEGDRIRIRFFVRDVDGAFVGWVWFGPRAEGPPLSAHGGSIAAVLDDAMGRACWVAGHMVLAGRISIDFRRRVPLGQVHEVEAWVDSVDGRKVKAKGRLLGSDESVLAESEGTFIQVTREHFEAERKRLQELGYQV